MNTPEEKLSLIASAFAVVDDPTADGNRASNARQTIRDVLAGHLVHVVSAGTYDVRTRERDEETKRADYFEGEADAMEATLNGAGIGVGEKPRNAAREAVETIAKLTADNAALHIDRDKALAAAEAMRADGRVGAGWVSPEEHEAMRRAWLSARAGAASLSDSLLRDAPVLLASVTEAHRDRDAARARLAEVEAERDRLRVLATKVDAIRNSIVGMQGFNFSEHGYPLVAALGEAGYEGLGYKIARENFGTLIEQTKKAEADLARVQADAEGLRAALRDGFAAHLASECAYAPGPCSCSLWSNARAALASPTPAQGDDISATSVVLKGGAP